jgi:nucleoside-diphosphate-sugar epimerase
MNQAIVTGGTGFVGTFLVRELLKNNIPTVVLSRSSFVQLDSRKKDSLKNKKCLFLKLAMEEIHLLPEKLKEKNIKIQDRCVFFNLAWGTAKNLSDLDIPGQLANVEWSLNAYNSALKLNCIKFIHVGTMEEGFARKYLELDYKSNNEYNRHLIYSLAKIASKDCLKLNYDKKHKMALIFANNSHVMGPLDNKGSALQVTLKKLLAQQ